MSYIGLDIIAAEFHNVAAKQELQKAAGEAEQLRQELAEQGALFSQVLLIDATHSCSNFKDFHLQH